MERNALARTTLTGAIAKEGFTLKRATMLKKSAIKYIIANSRRTNKAIAKELGCSPSSVAYHRKRLGLPPVKIKWDDSSIAKLVGLLHMGRSVKEIAAAFGTTTANIYVRMQKIKKSGQ